MIRDLSTHSQKRSTRARSFARRVRDCSEVLTVVDNAYGKGVTQALAGTGFLSSKRAKTSKTLSRRNIRRRSSRTRTFRRQYQGGINNLTGRGDGDKFLRNYQTPSNSSSDTALESQVAAKGYDYAKMKADGHSDEEIKAAVGL